MKIQRIRLFSSLVLIVLLGSLAMFVGCTAQPEPTTSPTPSPQPSPTAEVYEWKVQSTWAHGDIGMEALTFMAERAYERSDGRLKIEVFAEPEIVPLPEVLPACSRGTLDMAHGGGAIWSMVVPCGDVLFGSVPRIWNLELSAEEGALAQREFIFNTEVVDILREEFAKQNLYWLDMYTGAGACVLSTQEVHTLDDIAGLKIADLGGYMSQWRSMLGWVPVEMLPASEMEMSLRLGTIDAVAWDSSAITGFGWQSVAPYWISNEGQVTNMIQDTLVNMDSWNELPEDLKEALTGAMEDYFYEVNDRFAEQEAIIQQKVAAGEIIESLMDEEFQHAADEAAYEIWDQAAAESEASAKLIELIKEFRGI
jgi:TRAP-type mannitol/chloroaromatic compound transport system substrate-binding protein